MNPATDTSGYSDYQLRDYSFEEIKLDISLAKRETLNRSSSFSLVIPAYNEEKRIQPFLEHLKTNLPKDWEIIIVCDGNDKTAKIAQSIDHSFNVLEFDRRLGKGGAIKEGFKIATGNVVGFVDADGAVSAMEIEKVFRSVNPVSEVAVGSRWVNGSRVKTRQPLLRIILGRLYHYMTFAFLGLRTKDTQCGLKAFKADMINELINAVTLRNLSFDTAILYHCQKSGTKISEVPIVWRDVGGSKVRPVKTAFVMLLSLIGLKMANSKKSNSLVAMLSAVRKLIEDA